MTISSAQRQDGRWPALSRYTATQIHARDTVDATNTPVRSLRAGPDEVHDMLVDRWSDWQQQVIEAIRLDLQDVLEDVGTDDVDWEAWRPFFDEGRTPEAAVAKAFLRDV